MPDIKYLKDENGNIISPVTSVDSIFDTAGGGIRDYILNLIYPIGSIYISYKNEDPNVIFVGTWETTAKGRMIMGDVGDGVYANTHADNAYGGGTVMIDSANYSYLKAGVRGGEYVHTLTANESVQHTHGIAASALSHTHGITDPGHTHMTVQSANGSGSGVGTTTTSIGNGTFNTATSNSRSDITIQSGGPGFVETQGVYAFNGESHNNVSPYEVYYVWKRVA